MSDNSTQLIQKTAEKLYKSGGASLVIAYTNTLPIGTIDYQYCAACEIDAPVVKGTQQCLVCGSSTTQRPSLESIGRLPFYVLVKASNETDLNTSVLIIQEGIGQKDGGIASVYFADHNHDVWSIISPSERLLELVRYLQTEISYLKIDNDETVK